MALDSFNSNSSDQFFSGVQTVLKCQSAIPVICRMLDGSNRAVDHLVASRHRCNLLSSDSMSTMMKRYCSTWNRNPDWGVDRMKYWETDYAAKQEGKKAAEDFDNYDLMEPWEQEKIETNSRRSEFTHISPDGDARMVNVSQKNVTIRTAIAEGKVQLNQEIFELLKQNKLKVKITSLL